MKTTLKMLQKLLCTACLALPWLLPCAASAQKAPAPLFRDPVTDGAADPVCVWNRNEKCWWILYTQRRANSETANVAYCYGNRIGVAQSDDNGASWYYRGTLDLEFENGHNTFWAPEVVYDNGTYHLFAAYIRGVRDDFRNGGAASIVHYTSRDMWKWEYRGKLDLGTLKAIDISVFKKPDGGWRAWYKDIKKSSITCVADSRDLFTWENPRVCVPDVECEGQKVFRFKDYYWLITDEGHGLRVYRSTDLDHWESQGLLLTDASQRPEDGPRGFHCDVVVFGDKAYIIYGTHPGRMGPKQEPLAPGNSPYAERRSLLQCAELLYRNGTLETDRTDGFNFFLPSLDE